MVFFGGLVLLSKSSILRVKRYFLNFLQPPGAGRTKTTESQYYQRRNDPFGNVYDKVVERLEIAHILYLLLCDRLP